MEKEWMDSEEDLSVETVDSHVEEESETLEGLEINMTVISDTLQRLCEKSRRQKMLNKNQAVETGTLSSAGKKFVMDNIMYIDYRDLAALVGTKPDVLKDILNELGIKVPVQGARPWKEIDVGTFIALDACAKCQVQSEHSIFSVGIKNCRKCYEENIRNWTEEGETIRLRFFTEE